jgi:N,N'-diacetyllegionaminate synthase
MNKLHIIAELAQGFEGKPEQAAMLVRAAAASGADSAKLQLVFADELCTPDHRHYELFRSLEMPDQTWLNLKSLANSLDIGFILDVFGEHSLRLAETIKVDALKIHSTDMSNQQLLERVAASSIDTVMLSAGGCYAGEIKEAVERMNGKKCIVMHGFQGYPTATEDNHLARLQHLRSALSHLAGVAFGFADHVPSDDPLRFVVPAIAIGAGITYLEKHLTLSGVLKLEDHESALNPDDFAHFVRQMRDCARAYGPADAAREDFGMSESERKYRAAMHKQVIAGRDIAAGTILTAELVTLKRTSATDALHDLRQVIGRQLLKPLKLNDPITSEMLGKRG